MLVVFLTKSNRPEVRLKITEKSFMRLKKSEIKIIKIRRPFEIRTQDLRREGDVIISAQGR